MPPPERLATSATRLPSPVALSVSPSIIAPACPLSPEWLWIHCSRAKLSSHACLCPFDRQPQPALCSLPVAVCGHPDVWFCPFDRHPCLVLPPFLLQSAATPMALPASVTSPTSSLRGLGSARCSQVWGNKGGCPNFNEEGFWCEEGSRRCGSLVWGHLSPQGCQVWGRGFPGVGGGSSPNTWDKVWAEL